ncbi:COG1361 S-layer family protein [Halorubrum halophilum]|uniref:COG1361 S-layer family protein n=1 Tax=Halorubrum halophilum TaxID=413816 RepID=UPI00186AD596|nr:hypothetical protein [Halorubrum halophilum]
MSRFGVPVLAVLVVLALVTSGAAGFAAGAGPSGGAPTASLDAAAASGAVSGTAPTRALVRGSPELLVSTPDNTLTPGRTNELTLQISNDGDMDVGTAETRSIVTTARNVRVTADAGGTPFDIETGTLAIGSVTESAPGEATLSVNVPEDVERGTYDIDVEVKYSYTRQQDGGVTYDDDETIDAEVEVRISDDARFEIVDVATDARIGGEGNVTATLRNVGNEVARDAIVTGTTTGSAAVIGDGSADVFVGDWEPDANRTVTFESTVASSFEGGAYALVTSVDYRDPNGIDATSPTSRAGVVPAPEQSFSVDNVEGTLEVGYSGTVSGTLTNEGPFDVEDAVLIADAQSQRVSLGESRYALPDIPAGESVEFTFDADVNGNADPGPRQFRFTTEYTSGDSTVAVEETRRIEVAPRQPEFALAAENTTVAAGDTRRVAFTITNQRPETLSSINAGLYADSPLSAPNDEAFVDELKPGESTEIWFEVSAASGASVETHPIELDFRYDDERGNDRISDVRQFPIEVTESTDDGGLPTVPLVVGLLVVVAGAGAAVWYRRQ